MLYLHCSLYNIGILDIYSFLAEVNRVRGNLFHLNSAKDQIMLPEPIGPVVTLQEKLFVPVKDHPDVSITSTYLQLSNNY